jgi:hypothetical protein
MTHQIPSLKRGQAVNLFDMFEARNLHAKEVELLSQQGKVIEEIHQTLKRNEDINRELVEILRKNTRRPLVSNATGNFIGSAALALIVLILGTRSKWTSWLNTQFDKVSTANPHAAAQVATSLANILIFLVGATAVIMVILGGLRYVVSNGDSKNVEAAKNTILYAIVGVVVAILAYATVSLVTRL